MDVKNLINFIKMRCTNVENMFKMFYECKKFNQLLNNWKVDNVEDMKCMFCDCPIKEEYKPNRRNNLYE